MTADSPVCCTAGSSEGSANSFPCGTTVLKPGRIASFMRAATAGLVSISLAISI
jgi:hypothetical protein